MKFLTIFISLFFLLISCGDTKNYDPELQIPDIDAAGMSHGYNLTPLGCLLYTPFTADENNQQFNVQLFKDDRQVSSYAFPYSDIQKQLVFELQRNGTVNYWFKKDYFKSPIDTITLANGQTSFSHTIFHGDQIKSKVKNLYTSGSWKVNFKDSSLLIDFGKNDFNLSPLQGRYTCLGAGRFCFQQAIYFDSLANGRKETFKKNINIYYSQF